MNMTLLRIVKSRGIISPNLFSKKAMQTHPPSSFERTPHCRTHHWKEIRVTGKGEKHILRVSRAASILSLWRQEDPQGTANNY